MSPKAQTPRHRKPRAHSPRRLALRAGVAGGVLGTIAVTSGAAPTVAAGPPAAPEAGTAERPAVTAGLTASSARAADSLRTSAEHYALEEARAEAARDAARAAEKKAEARRAAARERAAEAAAEERSSRSAGRTTLDAGSEAASGNVAELVAFLRAQVGKAYVSGGTGPSSYDCSGLVQSAFRQIGVDLPRTSQEQSTAGTSVPVDSARPGDLVFWGGTGSAYHVAVYIGGGQYIDAANPGKGVVVQNVSDWPPESAARVL
jgi:cell wall-associated NlpC family hydrolase